MGIQPNYIKREMEEIISTDEIHLTDRVMDWHEQIFIPLHLRHSVGMDHAAFDGDAEDNYAGGLLILPEKHPINNAVILSEALAEF